jgi:hypothetical protein
MDAASLNLPLSNASTNPIAACQRCIDEWPQPLPNRRGSATPPTQAPAGTIGGDSDWPRI